MNECLFEKQDTKNKHALNLFEKIGDGIKYQHLAYGNIELQKTLENK